MITRDRKGEDTQIQREGQMKTGRDGNDGLTSHGIPRMARCHQKLRGRRGMNLFSELPEGTNPTDTLILDF